MPVQNALIGSRIAEDFSIDIAQLRVDRRQRGHRMPFAEREHVLPLARGIDNVEIQEPTIIESDQGNHRGESATGVKSLVHCIAALFQVQNSNIYFILVINSD